MKVSRNPRNYCRSNFHCNECGHVIPLPRDRGQIREYNHIKDIHCIRCDKTTKHTEERIDY